LVDGTVKVVQKINNADAAHDASKKFSAVLRAAVILTEDETCKRQVRSYALADVRSSRPPPSF
jgi:hypothetical protein